MTSRVWWAPLSDEPQKKVNDIEGLERQIENLRCSIIALIVTVTLVVGYLIIDSFREYSFYSVASFGLMAIVIFAILLICSYSFATDKM